MDGSKRWSMETYMADGKSISNSLMLRYRPIAPKPATVGPEINIKASNKRVKRKYVRRKIKGLSDEKIGRGGLDLDKTTAVTLQLLPEAEEADSSVGEPRDQDPSTWLSINNAVNDDDNMTDLRFSGCGSDRMAVAPPMTAVESWVTVQSVTETCTEEIGLGSTDSERVKNLGMDTSPGFISDGYNNRVEWINEAFKRMVMNGESSPSPPAIVVWLVTKENFCFPTFTCMVRVQYTCGNEKWSRTVPCDTWRMDCGSFAWRLDVKAALSLGR